MPGWTVTVLLPMRSTLFILDKSSSVPEFAVTQRVIELPDPVGLTGDGNRL